MKAKGTESFEDNKRQKNTKVVSPVSKIPLTLTLDGIPYPYDTLDLDEIDCKELSGMIVNLMKRIRQLELEKLELEKKMCDSFDGLDTFFDIVLGDWQKFKKQVLGDKND